MRHSFFNLRSKALLLVGITLVALILVVYGISSTLILSGFARLEAQNLERNVQRAFDTLSEDLNQLTTTAHDYGAWTDTYTFVQDRNQDYIEQNLIPETISNLKLSLIAYIRPDGEIVFGQTFDIEQGVFSPLPQAILPHLADSSLLLKTARANGENNLARNQSGILLLPQHDPLLIVSQAILKSDGTGPSQGSLIIGRYLDRTEIERLSNLTQLAIAFYNYKDPQLSPELRSARSQLQKLPEKTALVKPQTANAIVAYAFIRDIYNQPALILQVTSNRAIYQQGVTSVRYLIVFLLAAGAGFGCTILLLLEKLVLSRLVLLTADIRSIARQSNASLRVTPKGNDELALLANAINWMLSALEEAQISHRESEERFRATFEQAAVGIAHGSMDGQLILVNQRYCDILGYTREELDSLTYLELTHPDDLAADNHFMSQLIAGEIDTFSLEKRYLHKNKSYIWVNLTVTLVRDASGVAKYNIAVVEDITDRKRVQQALRESEERFRATFEQAAVGIAHSTLDGQTLLVNQKHCDIIGYACEELMTKTYQEITHPEDLEVDNAYMQQLLAGSISTFSMEKRYRRKDDSYVWVNLTISLVRSDRDEPKYITAVIQDITESKRVQQALQESEERFKAIAQATPIPVVISRIVDGKVLYANAQLGNVMGRPTAELLGDTTLDWYANLDNRRQLLDKLFQYGFLRNYEVQLKRTDGTLFWVLVSIELLTFNGEQAAVSVFLDITERKQVEAALQAAEERYRSIFENATEGIFQTSPNGCYLSANPALARIYGYSSPEQLMANLNNIERQLYVHPTRRAEFVAAIAVDGSVANFESQIYRKDGSTIWVSENARAVRDSQGNLLYYEGTVEDITARKLAEEALRYQQAQTEHLLLNILPAPIAERLKLQEKNIADSFAEVTVLFADIVGFTQLSSNVPPTELVRLLNLIFSAFDRLAERHGLEKIKTIGDAYMVVGGLPTPRDDHAEAIAEMALDMLSTIENFYTSDGHSFRIRIGINTGPVVAGVIGIKKFIYDLWGDTVNVASRMESQGLPNCIQVTETTYHYLKDKYAFEKRGTIKVKGKGDMITYLLIDTKSAQKSNSFYSNQPS